MEKDTTVEKEVVKASEGNLPIPINNNNSEVRNGIALADTTIKALPGVYGGTVLHKSINVPLRRPPPVVFVTREFIPPTPAERPKISTTILKGLGNFIMLKYVPARYRPGKAAIGINWFFWSVVAYGSVVIFKQLTTSIKEEWAYIWDHTVVRHHRRPPEEIDWVVVKFPGLREKALKVLKEREAMASKS